MTPELTALEVSLLQDIINLGFFRPENNLDSRTVAGLVSGGYLTKELGVTPKGHAGIADYHRLTS